MKVLVLGASGGVGAQAVVLAARAGHEVTAVSRAKIEVAAGVSVRVGDVQDASFLDGCVAGQDAVLSALGIRRKDQKNPFSPLASPADFTTRTARLLVDAMKRHQVRRVIAVSASGVGDSRAGLNLMMRFFVRWSNVGANYRDLEGMEAVFRESGLDWCCVRPTGLKDGPHTGRVREIEGFPFNAWISRADVAHHMVGLLGADLSKNRTPTVSEVVS